MKTIDQLEIGTEALVTINGIEWLSHVVYLGKTFGGNIWLESISSSDYRFGKGVRLPFSPADIVLVEEFKPKSSDQNDLGI